MNPITLIGNLKLAYKLAILAGIPIIGLLLLSWTAFSFEYKQKVLADNYQQYLKVTISAIELVHELQKERGASAGFIGSQGQSFVTTLPNQRLLTDEKLQVYNDMLEQFDQSKYDREIVDSLSKVSQSLSELNTMRTAVTTLNISVPEAVSYYTKQNSYLLHLSDILGKLSPNGEIGNLSTAYSTFLQSKERAGLERALLSNAFAADQFAPGVFTRFNTLIDTQEIYLNIFEASAPLRQIEFYQETMNDAAVTSVNKMRQLAIDNAQTGGFNVDPEVWFETITQKIGLLKAIEDNLASDLQISAASLADSLQAEIIKLIVETLVIIIVSLMFGYFIVRKLVVSLKNASDSAKKIAEGNLNNTIISNSTDEIGNLMHSLVEMQDKLKGVIKSTQSTAQVVSGTAQEIAQGNLNLSDRTEQQASSLEETAASMEEMTSTVKQNADNAKQANQLARAARDQAESGGSVVGNAVSAMNAINESSKKIADIISVIDEIAFQTNLLALNAAVEAARAGEQGRGFAVVASEVRNLAGRSATAAKEIKELIQDSVKKIEGGAELVNQSGQTLDEIVISVKKVSDIIAEIAAASAEQSSGIDQVGKAVIQMDDLTQQNAALVEEAAAASETMGNKAKYLAEMLSFFSVDQVDDLPVANDASSADKRKTIPNASANYSAANNDSQSAQVNQAMQPESVASAHHAAKQNRQAQQVSNSDWEEF